MNPSRWNGAGVAFLASFVLGGCTSPAPSATSGEQPVAGVEPHSEAKKLRGDLLVGRWFLDQPLADGSRRLTLAGQRADGTFEIRFRTTKPDGQVKESTEVGDWGTSGPVFFTITRGWIEGDKFVPAEQDVYFHEAYEILKLDRETFDFRNMESGSVYRSRRVDERFQLPLLTGS